MEDETKDEDSVCGTTNDATSIDETTDDDDSQPSKDQSMVSFRPSLQLEAIQEEDAENETNATHETNSNYHNKQTKNKEKNAKGTGVIIGWHLLERHHRLREDGHEEPE